jgi:hypothetical protein
MRWVIAVLTAIIIYSMTLVIAMPLKVEMISKFLLLLSGIGLSSKLSWKDLRWMQLFLTVYFLLSFEYGYMHKNWGELAIIISYFGMNNMTRFPILAVIGAVGLVVRSRSTQLIAAVAFLPGSPLRKFWFVIVGYHTVMFFVGYMFSGGVNYVSASASNLGRSTLITNALLNGSKRPFGLSSYAEYQATVDQFVLKVFNTGAYTDPHSIVMTSLVWLGPFVTVVLLWGLHRILKTYQVSQARQGFLVIVISVYLCTATMSSGNVLFLLWCFLGYFYEWRKRLSYSGQL